MNNANNSEQPVPDLPPGLSKPALRALTAAGYLQLEQFTKLTEPEVLKLHGMGPKAMELIRRTLAERGQSFAEQAKTKTFHDERKADAK